jgi:hypothetical protein
MQQNLATLTAFIVLFSILSLTFAVALSVGVKSGDWIEYNVTSTGAPMQGHDVQSARMEVTNVQSPNITVIITSRFTDGTNDTITSVLNIETGRLIDDFIIPANLNVGDSFPDQNYGNITITGTETKNYAGAQRTILSATIHNNTYYWDQATGVRVEGNTQTPEYTIHSVVSATNMWQASPVVTYDFLSISLVAAVVLIVVIAFAAIAVHYFRRRTCAKRSGVR